MQDKDQVMVGREDILDLVVVLDQQDIYHNTHHTHPPRPQVMVVEVAVVDTAEGRVAALAAPDTEQPPPDLAALVHQPRPHTMLRCMVDSWVLWEVLEVWDPWYLLPFRIQFLVVVEVVQLGQEV